MQRLQDAVRDATERAQLFLDRNSEALAGVDFTTVRRWLDDVVTSFTEHAADQKVNQACAKGATVKQRQIQRKLRLELMAPIAVIAQWSLGDVPELARLRLPNRDLRGQRLIAHARDMADAAAMYRDTFVSHGLPATFLDEIQAALDELAASSSERELHRMRERWATLGLAQAMEDGGRVLQVLDALVRRAASENEPLLRSWQEARRIQRSTVNTTTSAATAA